MATRPYLVEQAELKASLRQVSETIEGPRWSEVVEARIIDGRRTDCNDMTTKIDNIWRRYDESEGRRTKQLVNTVSV